MATTFGQIQEFSLEIEPIEAYIERVKLYFEASNIGADQRVAVLLSVTGGKNYIFLCNLCPVPRHWLN